MSVDCKAVMPGRFSAGDIGLILTQLGIEPLRIRQGDVEEFGTEEEPMWLCGSIITFNEPGGSIPAHRRTLHVFASNSSDYRDVTSEPETTVVSLADTGCARSVIRGIVEHTGGWFCPTDAVSGNWEQVAKTRGVAPEEVHAARVTVAASAIAAAAVQQFSRMGLNPDLMADFAAAITPLVADRLPRQESALDAELPGSGPRGP